MTSKRRSIISVVGFCIILFFMVDVLIFSGFYVSIPIELIYYLCVGWIIYLRRVTALVQPDFGTIGLGVVAFAIFVFGSHNMLRWFSDCGLESKSDCSDGSKSSDRPVHPAWKWQWTLMISGLLLLMFVAGICMVGMSHQIVWLANSRQPLVSSGLKGMLYKHKSITNLKQLVLGAHAVDHLNGTMPPGTLTDERGNALHGWMTSLLPYVEMGPMYDKIDLKKPWNDVANREFFQTRVPTFEILSLGENSEAIAARPKYPVSNYSGNKYVLGSQEGLSFDSISDGKSNTLLMGEVNTNLKPWGHPIQSRDPTLGLNRDPNGFGSRWAGVVQFGIADGSVRQIRTNIDPQVLKALATPSDGETIDPDDLY